VPINCCRQVALRLGGRFHGSWQCALVKVNVAAFCARLLDYAATPVAA
jgi:hypothetical protein